MQFFAYQSHVLLMCYPQRIHKYKKLPAIIYRQCSFNSLISVRYPIPFTVSHYSIGKSDAGCPTTFYFFDLGSNTVNSV